GALVEQRVWSALVGDAAVSTEHPYVQQLLQEQALARDVPAAFRQLIAAHVAHCWQAETVRDRSAPSGEGTVGTWPSCGQPGTMAARWANVAPAAGSGGRRSGPWPATMVHQRLPAGLGAGWQSQVDGVKDALGRLAARHACYRSLLSGSSSGFATAVHRTASAWITRRRVGRESPASRAGVSSSESTASWARMV